jgi:hypothetical protein
MPYGVTTLTTAVSTTPGASTGLSVSWRGGKPWSAWLTVSSSQGAGDFTLQASPIDLNSSGVPTSSGQLPGPSWFNLTAADFGISSAVTSSNGYSAIHFSVANQAAADVIRWTSNAPVAALRLNSTALSSATISLTVLSGEGW